MPLLSIDYINQCFLLDFMLKIDKKKLPLHESHFVKATAPSLRNRYQNFKEKFIVQIACI